MKKVKMMTGTQQLIFIILLLLTAVAVIAQERTEGGSVLTFIKELFEKEEIHLSPEVRGRVLDNGKPVSGLKISRQLGYNDEKIISDYVKTDQDGFFYFKELVIKKSPYKMDITHQQIRQVILAEGDSEAYVLWDVVKHGIKPLESFSKKLSTLNCDLTTPKSSFVFSFNENRSENFRFPYDFEGETICRWDEDFKLIDF